MNEKHLRNVRKSEERKVKNIGKIIVQAVKCLPVKKLGKILQIWLLKQNENCKFSESTLAIL